MSENDASLPRLQIAPGLRSRTSLCVGSRIDIFPPVGFEDVARWLSVDDVGDIDVLAADSGFGKAGIEELARWSDEVALLLPLMVSPISADDQ
jgi:hypothetical protein